MSDSNMRKPQGVIVIEGHVQGLANTRLLGQAGIPVIVVDKGNCVARHSKYCTGFYQSPDYSTDAFARFLLNLHSTLHLQDWLLLPSNDHAVYTIARNKTKLGECYNIITEDVSVIDKIYNKRELLKLALAAEIPIPESVFPETENPKQLEIRYPVIIKGNNGLSFYKLYHKKAIIANTDQDLVDVWDNTLERIQPSEYFIQEVIPAGHKTVSVTLFAIKGKVFSFWMGAKLREHPVAFGTATCCKSVFDQEMLELSERLIDSIGYTGVCEVEWLRDPRDGKPKLIEINARTWLWVGLAAKCGVNYPLIIYNYLTRGSVPHRVSYPVNKTWINLYTDLPYSIQGIIKGIHNLGDILKTYKSFTEACWDRNDIRPFFAYPFLLCKYLRER